MFDNYYGVLWQYQPPLFSNFIFGLSLSEKTNFYFPSPSFHFSEIIPLFSSLLFSISIKKNSSLCLSLSRKLNTQTLLEPQHFSLVISSVSHRTPESFVVVSHLREASSFPLSPMIVETVRLIASPIVAEKRSEKRRQRIRENHLQSCLNVSFVENPIMSSCVKPLVQNKEPPIVLLHGFDSSCLEWRYGYPLLEESGFETWAIDILGWGFSDLENLPPCDVVSKRNHFYQFWKSYIRRPMILVGPSLGSVVAIDFVVNYPEAVEKLILIDASVYAEGTGNLATLPRSVAYAGVYLLKSLPLRLYANYLTFTNMSLRTILDGTNVGRLHCLLPWWDDATVDFMTSGGYKIAPLIRKICNCLFS